MAWCDRYKNEKIVICQEGPSNKFWAAHYDEATKTVHIRWGRIGQSGQTQEKSFESEYAAANFIDTKYREKARKNYKKIDKTQFDKLCIEAAIIGTANKCEQMRWVEIKDIDKLKFVDCTEARLQDPQCVPGIVITAKTKKVYDGQTTLNILFTFDNSYDLNNNTAITKTNPLYEITAKIEEAIGRSLSMS